MTVHAQQLYNVHRLRSLCRRIPYFKSVMQYRKSLFILWNVCYVLAPYGSILLNQWRKPGFWLLRGWQPAAIPRGACGRVSVASPRLGCGGVQVWVFLAIYVMLCYVNIYNLPSLIIYGIYNMYLIVAMTANDSVMSINEVEASAKN